MGGSIGLYARYRYPCLVLLGSSNDERVWPDLSRAAGDEMAKKETRARALWFGLGLVLIGSCGLALAWIDRDSLPAVGATLLGFIIGMIVGFFAQEAKEWTRSAMTASAAVLTGAGAMALLRYGAPEPQGVWFYPVGLVLGFGFGTIWDAIDPP